MAVSKRPVVACRLCGAELTAESVEDCCPNCRAPANDSASLSLASGAPSTSNVRAAGTAAARDADRHDSSPARPEAKVEESIGKFGRFRLLNVVGEGASGIVYRAIDPTLQRQVAVKTPRFVSSDPKQAERFLREARAVSRLRHPNIAMVFDCGHEKNTFYIASEFIEGENFEQRLAKSPPTFRQSVEWVRDVARGLEYAHQKGIVHRDVKPANLMLSTDDRVVITDFGIARRMEETSTMTADGSVLGTPAYMSPEQARGDNKAVNALSDQYSLGVVLFELLTGRRPFLGTALQVLSDVVNKTPPLLTTLKRDVPKELQQICLRAMSKSPVERYAATGDLADDLDRWLRGKPIEKGRATRRAPLHSVRWTAAIISVAILLILAATVFIVSDRGTLEVTTLDDNVQLSVTQNGREIAVLDRQTGSKITLRSGEYEVALKGSENELTLSKSVITLKRGQATIVEVRHKEKSLKSIPVDPLPVEVAALRVPPVPPPEERAPSPVAAAAAPAPQLSPQSVPAGVVSERTVAELVLKLGGSVHVDGEFFTNREIPASGTLPDSVTAVRHIHLSGSSLASDANLELLKGAKHLEGLWLENLPRLTGSGFNHLEKATTLRAIALGGDVGLSGEAFRHFSKLTNLNALFLISTGFNDESCRHIGDLVNLGLLDVGNTQVTDEGLKHIGKLTKLGDLNLSNTRVTDAGLVHLTTMKQIGILRLNYNAVTDAGMSSIAKLRSLRTLNLGDTGITDNGLAHLISLSYLISVDLRRTKITDTGLKLLQKTKSLREILLADTKTSEEGRKALKAVLPDCRVDNIEVLAARPATSIQGTTSTIVSPLGNRSDDFKRNISDNSNVKDSNKVNDSPSVPLTVADELRALNARKIGRGYRASWSPNGKRLVYGLQTGGLEIYDVEKQATSSLLTRGKDPAWCPTDESMIAFVREENGSEELWLTDSSGQSPRKLSQGGFPGWSTDPKTLYLGKTLYFRTNDNRGSFLSSVNPKASVVEFVRVLEKPIPSFYPCVSGDGRYAGCVVPGRLVLIDIADPLKPWDLVPIGKCNGGVVGWSPDSKYAAFGSYGFGDTTLGFWLIERESKRLAQILNGPATAPVWSPDGTQMAFDIRSVDSALTGVWIINVKELNRLTQDAARPKPVSLPAGNKGLAPAREEAAPAQKG